MYLLPAYLADWILPSTHHVPTYAQQAWIVFFHFQLIIITPSSEDPLLPEKKCPEPEFLNL